MQLAFLDSKNDLYTEEVDCWRQCSALYKGGDDFKSLISEFLPPNPMEPHDVYAMRKREASYTNYVGPIINYYVSWLFSGQFSVRAKQGATQIETDSFYTDFQSDVGGDINLMDFMRARSTEAMKNQCAHWLIELPPTELDVREMDMAQWKALGLGEATLRPVTREELYDWECDAYGKLRWCVIHNQAAVRGNPRMGARNTIRETWELYERDTGTVETFELVYQKGKRPRDPKFDVPSVGKREYRFKEIPLVTLDVGSGLAIGDMLRSPQIEHFRLNCAKSWLMRRTCYAMPVFNLEDEKSLPTMGTGYGLSMGLNDKAGWLAPPSTPFDMLSKDIAAQRDEIFRIVHQMAQGLDNNAETVGRSADSKQIDTAATRIMLNAYGSIVRKAIEETLEILSDARGDDDVEWSIEGFNGYDTATAGELLGNASLAQELGIPSKTFRREIKTKAALALLPETSPHIHEDIRREIREACDQMVPLEELALPVEYQAKLDIQEDKSKTAIKIQNQKDMNVLRETTMAHSQKAADKLHIADVA